MSKGLISPGQGGVINERRAMAGMGLREFLMEGGNLPFTIINQIALASNNAIALTNAAGRILTLPPRDLPNPSPQGSV